MFIWLFSTTRTAFSSHCPDHLYTSLFVDLPAACYFLVLWFIHLLLILTFIVYNWILCRCGHEFCYRCGAEWKNKKATCSCPIWDERNIEYDSDSDSDWNHARWEVCSYASFYLRKDPLGHSVFAGRPSFMKTCWSLLFLVSLEVLCSYADNMGTVTESFLKIKCEYVASFCRVNI